VEEVKFEGAAGSHFTSLDDSIICPCVRPTLWPSLVELALDSHIADVKRVIRSLSRSPRSRWHSSLHCQCPLPVTSYFPI
jgi:hypothetical protein